MPCEKGIEVVTIALHAKPPAVKLGRRPAAKGPNDPGRDFDVRAGHLLRFFRLRRKISREFLAAACTERGFGLVPQQIHKYEAGINRMPIERLCQFGEVLDFDPGEFLCTVAERDAQGAEFVGMGIGPMITKLMVTGSRISDPDDMKALLALARHFARGK
jgi:transcriptional regulator with XRE-family HTH domain